MIYRTSYIVSTYTVLILKGLIALFITSVGDKYWFYSLWHLTKHIWPLINWKVHFWSLCLWISQIYQCFQIVPPHDYSFPMIILYYYSILNNNIVLKIFKTQHISYVKDQEAQISISWRLNVLCRISQRLQSKCNWVTKRVTITIQKRQKQWIQISNHTKN